MVLKSIELSGFKSFAKKSTIIFDSPVTGIVGPNGSGKSNVVESIRFVLGEQSIKSLRGKGGSDMIFKGSKQLSALSRASVTIVFDNKNRIFSFADSVDTKAKVVLYDEVRLTREVYSDGTNRYLINDVEVRLRDIIELLSSVNIGSSGHHIISQGEADRILSSNAKDRRLMIEDALGLKIYQFRIKETEKRLLKTEANMKEVGALKRELAPHLTYLKKQVEKIEKASLLRDELITLYQIYCKREKHMIAQIEQDIFNQKTTLLQSYNEVSELVQTLEKEKNAPFVSLFDKEYLETIHSLSELGRLKNELERSLGRLEGTKEALLNPVTQTQDTQEKFLPFSSVKNTFSEINTFLEQVKNSSDISFIQDQITRTQNRIHEYLHSFETKTEHIPQTVNQAQIEALQDEIRAIEQSIFDLEQQKTTLEIKKKELEEKMESERYTHNERQKGYYEVLSKKEGIEVQLRGLDRESNLVLTRQEAFQVEIREGIALLGIDMPSRFEDIVLEKESLETQDELKRKIERVKIKLEESGGLGGSDTLKEYESTKDRDQFLTQELIDLETSIKELRQLIAELKIKLDLDFKHGVEKINQSFNNFFSLMFGGGSAGLSISVEHKRRKKDTEDEDTVLPDVSVSDEEEMEFERGIDIHVSLPHKKVKELGMLSGGERSLTSIALLFAMSQVNPPPFLVLDETDAALDEANSRRYGDMIENLSSVSQLVVVTHNRETMSRAGVLYGVTVGPDGGSKLLSIKFDDASVYAK